MHGFHQCLKGTWHNALAASFVAMMILAGMYWTTLHTIMAIWMRSDTFAHGFLIFPISIWLIWRRRQILSKLTPVPDWRALPVLAVIVAGWSLAGSGGVLAAQQAALVAMLPSMVWLVLGRAIAWELAFPLGFLFFMVPAGEFLIPPMMDFTATFTVKMLRLSGIPVYREGTFFSIPSGDWSVIEACSGLRYLIASITLGCLYAYLTYHTLLYRIIFIALATGFPVVANGLRAYLIVMLAHLSDHKLAVGMDHYIYGWIFFGFVMLVLFWIGSFWREYPPLAPVRTVSGGNPAPPAADRKVWIFWCTAVAGMALAWLGPAREAQLERLAAAQDTPLFLIAPKATPPWREIIGYSAWEPSYPGADAAVKTFFSNGSHTVAASIYYYRRQKQGEELIGSQNVLIPQNHPVWRLLEETSVDIRIPGVPANIHQAILQSHTEKLLVWRWLWVAGRYTANDYWGKWLEARDKFMGRFRDGAALVFATKITDDENTSRKTLENFVAEMLPALDQALVETSRR